MNLARLFAGVFLKSLCLQLRDHLLAHLWISTEENVGVRWCRPAVPGLFKGFSGPELLDVVRPRLATAPALQPDD